MRPTLATEDAAPVRVGFHPEPIPGAAYDGGEPVPVSLPVPAGCDENERPDIAAILDALEDAGALFPDRAAAGDVLSPVLDRYGDRRAAEILMWHYSRLPGGRRGDELRAAFLGSVEGESLDETASRHGVTKQTWWRAIERLRARLLKNG